MTIFWSGLLLWWYLKKTKRRSLPILVLSILWLLIITASPIPKWWAGSIEESYPSITDQSLDALASQPVHIMVLGSGYINDPDLVPSARLGTTAIGRLAEGLRCYNQLPKAKFITSGRRNGTETSKPQAEMSALAAIDLGIDPMDTLHLSTTINTEDEARKYVARFGTNHQVLISTDAIHMPRALFWFRHFGVAAIEAPCNHRMKLDPENPTFPFKPQLAKVELIDDLIHESIGLFYAKLKTDSKK